MGGKSSEAEFKHTHCLNRLNLQGNILESKNSIEIGLSLAKAYPSLAWLGYNIVIYQYRNIVIFNITILQYYNFKILQHYNNTILKYYNNTILQNFKITKLLYYNNKILH